MQGGVARKCGGVDVAAALKEEVDQDEVLCLHSIMKRGAATTGILLEQKRKLKLIKLDSIQIKDKYLLNCIGVH